MLMKRLALILGIALVVPLLMGAAGAPMPAVRGGEDGAKVSLRLPGFLIRAGAWFVPAEHAEFKPLIRKLGGIRVLVLDGSWYDREVRPGDFGRTASSLEREGYAPLVGVEGPEERVRLAVRTNRRGLIRRLAVVVDDGESFVHVRLRCRLTAGDLADLMRSGMIEGMDAVPVRFVDEAAPANPS